NRQGPNTNATRRQTVPSNGSNFSVMTNPRPDRATWLLAGAGAVAGGVRAGVDDQAHALGRIGAQGGAVLAVATHLSGPAGLGPGRGHHVLRLAVHAVLVQRP